MQPSPIQPIAATLPANDHQPVEARGERCFGVQLRELRQGLDIKQIALSRAISCSDAAISLWETSTRLPRPRMLSRLLEGLAAAGVSSSELLVLRQRWSIERKLRIAAMTRPAALNVVALHAEPT